MREEVIKLTNNYKSIVKSAIVCLVSAFFLAISAQISIPFPGGVPMTLQTFSIAFIGYSLSKEHGIGAILSYLILGTMGLPVFAGAKFGIGTILGITGGFLIGFILLVSFCNKAKQSKSIIRKIILSITGLLLVHIFGILQYSILTTVTITKAFLLVSLPFLFKDLLSVILAFILTDMKLGLFIKCQLLKF